MNKDDVAAFVFWSKNFRPFFKVLDRLDECGYDKKIFHFTITGHNKLWMEPNIPVNEITIPDFIELSKSYGKDVMFWRYDPIVIFDDTYLESEKMRFVNIANFLAPYINSCIISVAFFYNKVRRSFRKLDDELGISITDPDVNRKRDYVGNLVEWADEYGIRLRACCCDYLLDIPGIEQAHCIDGDLISRLWYPGDIFKPQPSRKGCGCSESSDIGEYGTCRGGCIYCYAQ